MGSWTSRMDMKTSGGRQRCGRPQEKEGGMHEARLGITEKETGMREHSKELGEGRRRYGAGTLLTREAYGYWGGKWHTQARREGCISLLRAKWHSYGTGPTYRAQDISWIPEYPLKDPAQQGELMLGVDRACELLANDSAIASIRSNFKC